jgi:hypothetical protein
MALSGWDTGTHIENALTEPPDLSIHPLKADGDAIGGAPTDFGPSPFSARGNGALSPFPPFVNGAL